jgi:ATPase family associated with various cellular activities (AAA)
MSLGIDLFLNTIISDNLIPKLVKMLINQIESNKTNSDHQLISDPSVGSSGGNSHLPPESETGIIPFKLLDYSAIGDFICKNDSFIDEIEDLKEKMINYSNKSHAVRPLNISVVANPGSGKSYLIKQITKSIVTSPETENIKLNASSITSLKDLIQVFLSVGEFITHGSKFPILFIDEVDSKIQGDYVYEKLLGLMADGEFYDDGKPKEIKRFILFTASSGSWDPIEDFEQITEPNLIDYPTWKELKEKRIKKYLEKADGKLKDFMDRVDYWLIVPPLSIAFRDTTDYFNNLKAVLFTMIKKHFPSIKQVEYSITHILASLLQSNVSVRQIEQILFMANINNEEIFSYSSLPQSTQNKFDSAKEICENDLQNQNLPVDTKYEIQEWQTT